MKAWLRRLFYLDDPAQGVFFALTLLIAGSYIFFSLVVISCGKNWLLSTNDGNVLLLQMGLIALPPAVLLLYYLTLTVIFFDRMTGRWHAVWIGFGGWVVLLVLFNLSIPKLDFGWNLIGMAAFWVMLHLMNSGKEWKCALGTLALLLLGGWIVAMPFNYSRIFRTGSHMCLHTPPVPEFPAAVQRFFGISGYGWMLWVGIGLLFLLLGYLAFARFLAGLGNRSFRAMFQRPVLALLASAVVAYLVFLMLVIFARREYAADLATLDRHFGRPVSVAGIRQFYYGNAIADRNHWEHVAKLDEKVASLNELDFDRGNFVSLTFSEAAKEHQRGLWRSAEAAVRDYELAFSGEIPPPELEFELGGIAGMVSSHLDLYQTFFRLELWRIRFALEDGDFDAAFTAYRRLGEATRSLRRETLVFGGRVWLTGIDSQLIGLQLLLESGKLSEPELARLAGELRRLESAIPEMQFRCIYGEAIMGLDFFDLFAEGIWFERENPPPFPLKTMRFFVPQLWWYSLRGMSQYARCFLAVDFNGLPKTAAIGRMSLLIRLSLMTYASAGTRFDITLARLRAMRGLIAAEEYKRTHGDYPDCMSDLPLDPFCGKPLLYRKGICPYRLTHVKWNLDPASKSGGSWQTETTDTEIPAIQVWSVGPDRIDNCGVSDRETKADDVGAMLRLKP
ncbi:MAG: hypothetical protein AB7F32_00905 [Victivallaceae bacterium]